MLYSSRFLNLISGLYKYSLIHVVSDFKDINGCLVLNPGRLTDKKSRGTFARLVITPPNRDETNLSNYVACQVIKV